MTLKARLPKATLNHGSLELGIPRVHRTYAKAPADQLAAMLRSHTHGHNPVAVDLREQVALYAEELKRIAVFKPSTDVQKYAARVTADVLA